MKSNMTLHLLACLLLTGLCISFAETAAVNLELHHGGEHITKEDHGGEHLVQRSVDTAEMMDHHGGKHPEPKLELDHGDDHRMVARHHGGVHSFAEQMMAPDHHGSDLSFAEQMVGLDHHDGVHPVVEQKKDLYHHGGDHPEEKEALHHLLLDVAVPELPELSERFQ